MPVGSSFGSEHEYPPDDSLMLAFIGMLACCLLMMTLGSSILALLLFGSTIVAAMQGTLATQPVNILAGPVMPFLVVASIIFFAVACFQKAEEWGEKIAGEQIRDNRRYAALAEARDAREREEREMRVLRRHTDKGMPRK